MPTLGQKFWLDTLRTDDMSSSILLQFAVLQCSNALSQMSNLCLSLPNYNLSLPILCSGYQPEKYMYGCIHTAVGSPAYVHFKKPLLHLCPCKKYNTTASVYTWWLCIHSPPILHYNTRKRWLLVDHCFYDRMVSLSLHVHCMQNQSPSS